MRRANVRRVWRIESQCAVQIQSVSCSNELGGFILIPNTLWQTSYDARAEYQRELALHRHARCDIPYIYRMRGFRVNVGVCYLGNMCVSDVGLAGPGCVACMCVCVPVWYEYKGLGIGVGELGRAYRSPQSQTRPHK